MAKGGGDKITVAEVKAATGMTSGVGKMSQAERAEAIASAKVSGGGGQPNAPSGGTATSGGGALSQVATAPAGGPKGGYIDAPTFSGALAQYAENTPIIGQFQNRAGKDFYITDAGKVVKVTPKGTVKEISRFNYGTPTSGMFPDYDVERRSGKVANYPSSTVKLYNPVTGQPVEEEEKEKEDTIIGGGGTDFTPAPYTASGVQYGVTDQLPWYSGPNSGRRALNLGAPGSGDYSLPSGNKIFGINWQSDPFSGKNWGDTMMATTGMSDADLYSGFMQAAQTGNFSLSGLAREMGLPPGAVHEMYSRIVQWAAQNNQPIPQFPQFSESTAPYYTYGFGPSVQQVGYDFTHQGDNPATTPVETSYKTWDVNPLGNWMDALHPPATTSTTPTTTGTGTTTPTTGTTTPTTAGTGTGTSSAGATTVTPPPVTPPTYDPTRTYMDMIWGGSEGRPTVGYANGGSVRSGLGGIQQDPAIKRYIKTGGRAGGQDDNIPAMLSENEYVFDADTVAALGDGNPDAGAAKLDKMRQNIRTHKRSAPATKIPPKAKAPEQYLRKGK